MPNLILIADDDENDALALQKVLKKAEVRNPVMTVNDGSRVLELLKGDGKYRDRKRFPLPKILMLDLKMSRMDGFEVMEWIQVHKEFAGILIVVLNANGELQNIRESYRLGARTFLTKPCELADVCNLIRGYPTYWDCQHEKIRRTESEALS